MIFPLPCHSNLRSSLQQLAFAISHALRRSCAIQRLYIQRYHYSQKNQHLTHSFQCFILALFKGIVENIGRFTQKGCQVFLSDPRLVSGTTKAAPPSMRATESLLWAGILSKRNTYILYNIPFWVENPRSRNVVCIITIRIIYVEVHFYTLLLLRAIARPKTIQIIGNTCPCRIGEPWKPCFTLTQTEKNVISLNVVPSLKKERSKENLHEINCRMHHKIPPFFFLVLQRKETQYFSRLEDRFSQEIGATARNILPLK